MNRLEQAGGWSPVSFSADFLRGFLMLKKNITVIPTTNQQIELPVNFNDTGIMATFAKQCCFKPNKSQIISSLPVHIGWQDGDFRCTRPAVSIEFLQAMKRKYRALIGARDMSEAT